MRFMNNTKWIKKNILENITQIVINIFVDKLLTIIWTFFYLEDNYYVIMNKTFLVFIGG